MSALPGPLPPGEHLLWQGRPEWRALARDALHVRGLATYMAALVASVAAASVLNGGHVVRDTAVAAVIASIPVAWACVYAWLSARSARYAITDRRIVLRIGVALPMTINLPFARIASAGLRERGATGEIRVKLLERDGLAAIMLWPHAPFGSAQPILRGLLDARRAGQVLARALAASTDDQCTAPLAQTGRIVETAAPDHGAQAVAA